MKLSDNQISCLLATLDKIPGGYSYSGACSLQVCFPLKAGGELRFCWVDSDVAEAEGVEPFGIDLYDGALSPCITGPSKVTG